MLVMRFVDGCTDQTMGSHRNLGIDMTASPQAYSADVTESGERDMARQKRPRPAQGGITSRTGRAQPHKALLHNRVHVFVDDQNLFYGIRYARQDYSYRIDFGRMLLEIAKDSKGNTRGVESAYIAGVIPDDDSFWQIANNQGFVVRRGYLGAGKRSKQDDAYLISDPCLSG
jgi:hypothetical protein